MVNRRDKPYTKDSPNFLTNDDSPYFDWGDVEYGMAFTDVIGNLLWFVQHIGPLDACFKTETGLYLDTNKMTLLRVEEYDYHDQCKKVFKRADGRAD